LNAYESRAFSQGGEDGILAALFLRIGAQAQYFVEFGVSDGLECNAARFALGYGWRGLMIEGDAECFAALADVYRSHPRVTLVNAFVDRDSIGQVFAQAGVPREFDLLSIDVDGNDYWIWQALRDYRPRVVVIEYNAFHPPPERWVIAYNPSHRWDGTTYFGASLASLGELGRSLGYALLGTTSNGVNAIFLRRDLLGGAGFPEKTAQEAYHRNRGSLLFRLRPGSGPSESV
jgi:hypothetical protein